MWGWWVYRGRIDPVRVDGRPPAQIGLPNGLRFAANSETAKLGQSLGTAVRPLRFAANSETAKLSVGVAVALQSLRFAANSETAKLDSRRC